MLRILLCDPHGVSWTNRERKQVSVPNKQQTFAHQQNNERCTFSHIWFHCSPEVCWLLDHHSIYETHWLAWENVASNFTLIKFKDLHNWTFFDFDLWSFLRTIEQSSNCHSVMKKANKSNLAWLCVWFSNHHHTQFISQTSLTVVSKDFGKEPPFGRRESTNNRSTKMTGCKWTESF